MSTQKGIQLLAQNVKPTTHLRLAVEAVGVLLGAEHENLPAYAVPNGSVYGPTITMLCDDLDTALEKLKTMEADDVSLDVENELLAIIDEEGYDDANDVMTKDGELVETLQKQVSQIVEKLSVKEKSGERLYPYTTFAVGIDGSRMSYYAFHVATLLRRFGSINMLCVDEIKDDQKIYTSEFVMQDFVGQCKQLNIRPNKYKMLATSNLLKQKTTANALLSKSEELKADFIIVGSFGRSGPQTLPLCSTAIRLVEDNTFPVIVVPPSAECTVKDNQGIDTPSTFVVAVDGSEMSNQCMGLVVSLMKPADKLEIIHICNPDWEEGDKEKFIAPFQDKINLLGVSGNITVSPIKPNIPIAESINEFISDMKATYSIIGKTGVGAQEHDIDPIQISSSKTLKGVGQVAKALLRSPRTITIVCK